MHFHLATYYNLYLENYNENFTSFSQPPFLNFQFQNKQRKHVYCNKPYLQQLAQLKSMV
jgi:hypothetical protein